MTSIISEQVHVFVKMPAEVRLPVQYFLAVMKNHCIGTRGLLESMIRTHTMPTIFQML